jgi:hypothetical protein
VPEKKNKRLLLSVAREVRDGHCFVDAASSRATRQ